MGTNYAPMFRENIPAANTFPFMVYYMYTCNDLCWKVETIYPWSGKDCQIIRHVEFFRKKYDIVQSCDLVWCVALLRLCVESHLILAS